METHYSQLILAADPSGYVPSVAEDVEEVRVFDLEQFGVTEVKELVTAASRRPTTGQWLHVVCRFKSVTHEAQNALLKVLEDTPSTTHITLVAPPDCELLPTVLSRLQVSAASMSCQSVGFTEFAALPVAERLQQIDSRLKAKDMDWVREVKRGLTAAVRTGGVVINHEIEFVERWLLVRGASNKMLLEHLALRLPGSKVPSSVKR